MTSVNFDFETDLRFFASLADLGPHASVDIFDALQSISSRRYSWAEFVQQFGWEPLDLTNVDTFPGSNELHRFHIGSPSNQLYEIVGYTYENVVVVCAVARKG